MNKKITVTSIKALLNTMNNDKIYILHNIFIIVKNIFDMNSYKLEQIM